MHGRGVIMGSIRIPVVEENFEILRKKKSYYVD